MLITDVLKKQLTVDTRTVLWFIVMTAGTVVLQALATLDPNTVTDWKTWAVGLGVQSLRSVATTALALLTKPGA